MVGRYRILMVVLLAMVAVAHSGCAICSNPHDCKYPAYGGIIERVDQVHGRVGSLYGPQPIFVPGDTPVTAEVPDVPSATPDANTTDESPQEGPESGRFDRRPDLPPPPDFDQLDDNLDYPPSLDESIL